MISGAPPPAARDEPPPSPVSVRRQRPEPSTSTETGTIHFYRDRNHAVNTGRLSHAAAGLYPAERAPGRRLAAEAGRRAGRSRSPVRSRRHSPVPPPGGPADRAGGPADRRPQLGPAEGPRPAHGAVGPGSRGWAATWMSVDEAWQEIQQRSGRVCVVRLG